MILLLRAGVFRTGGGSPRRLLTFFLMQLEPPPGLWPQALRPGQHHDDQQCAIDQITELGKFTQEIPERPSGQGAHENTRDATHAADDDQRQHVDRNQKFMLCG